MEKKLLILDGTSLLADSYYKTLTKEVEELISLRESGKSITEKEELEAFSTLLQSKEGVYINGVQGFFKTLFDALDKRHPSHIAIVWGAQRENNFRRKIFPGYKDDGKVKDKALLKQEELVKNILKNMNIYQLESLEYEALDLAGSLAQKFYTEIEVEIIARNTMSLQLTDVATVWFKTPKFERIKSTHKLDDYDFPKGTIKFDSEFLEAYKKLKPHQLPDYRALVGNPYFNIPGVKSVGDITTISILEEYETIDRLYQDIDKCKTREELVDFGNTLKKYLVLAFNPIEFLVKGRDEAFLGKDLATYRRDVLGKEFKNSNNITFDSFDVKPIDKTSIVKELKAINLSPIKGNVTKRLSEIINGLDFSSLLSSYNPFMFSPSDPSYIGDRYSIENVPAEIIINDESNRLVFITDEAIKSLGDKVKINTSSTVYYSENAINNRLSEKETAQNERQVAIITNSIKQNNKEDKSISSNTIIATANLSEEEFTSGEIEYSEEINEEEFECDNPIQLEITSIQTSFNNSKKTKEQNKETKNNISELTAHFNGKPKESSKSIGLRLVESIVINRYHCSHCNETFTLFGSYAKLCTNCGASLVVGEEFNEASLPIAEQSNCNLNDLKLKRDNENLELIANSLLI